MNGLLNAAFLSIATGLLAGAAVEDPPAHPARLRTRLELPVEGKPLGLLPFDFSGDGSNELCAVTKSPGALHVFRGLESGIGATLAPIVIPIGDYPVGPIASNGQLVAGSRAASELYWFDEESLEKHSPHRTVRLESSPRVLVSADLNRDGIETVCVFTKENEILLANADGMVEQTFTAHDQPCSAWPLADGRLVVGFQVGRQVCVYRRDPAQKAGWSVDWEVEFVGIPRAIRELDIDGDGDLELVIAGGDRDHWVLGLEGKNGCADWIDAEVIAPRRIRRGAIPYALDAIRRGGRDELLSMAYFEPAWYRFVGNPPELIEAGYAGQAPVALCASDFDGDGQPDVAIANSEARRVSLLFGNADGSLSIAPQVRTGRAPTALIAADLDRDGKAEAITLNALENTYSVVRWNGEALEVVETADSGSETTALAVGDLNADGQPDLVVLRRDSKGGVVRIRYGLSSGEDGYFERAGKMLRGPEETHELAVGRSASDVLLFEERLAQGARLCVTDPEGDALHVLERKAGELSQDFALPERVLRLRSSLPLASSPTALARLDDSGERVAVALAGPGERTGIAIVSVFGDPIELDFLPLSASPLDICSGDFDGDGRLDLGVLALDHGRDGAALFLSFLARDDGFVAGPPMRTGLRVHSIVAGDLNGDGLADVVASAQNSHHVNLWLSRKGSPVAFEPQADLGLETGPLGLGFADADGDGRLDLFVANAFANSVSLVLNESAD